MGIKYILPPQISPQHKHRNFMKYILQKRKLSVDGGLKVGLSGASGQHRKNYGTGSTKGQQENVSFCVGQSGATLAPRIPAVCLAPIVLKIILCNPHSIHSSTLISGRTFLERSTEGWSPCCKWYVGASFFVISGCWAHPWRSWGNYNNSHTENQFNDTCSHAI